MSISGLPDLDEVTPGAMRGPFDADPWKIRGPVLLSALAFAKQHVTGGVAAVKEKLNPELRAYVSARGNRRGSHESLL